MISWIQRTFQRHFGLVFLLILAAMAIPLVVVFTPSSGIGQGRSRSRHQEFFGKDLGNEAVSRQVFDDANRSVVLKAGYAALNGAQFQEYALHRTASLALADRLHLPPPTKEELSAYIATLPLFQDEQGHFDPKRYAQFADNLKSNTQFTTADANRVLRDDARLAGLDKLLGGPGYALPNEIREQLARSDASWTLQVASLDYKAFDPSINITDEALQKFYNDSLFRYQVPARLKASMVEFKASDYAPPNSPTEQQLRAYYDRNPARFPAPPEAPGAPKPPAPQLGKDSAPADNFAKVRPQVEAAMRQDAALSLASKAANDFTIALYEKKLTPNSPGLEAFLASYRKTAMPIEPFPPHDPPDSMAWLQGHGDELARIGGDNARYFSDPIQTPDGFAVIIWNETLPTYQPILAEVKDKVAADYRDNEKRKLFIEKGHELERQLQAAVKAGTPFEKAAADAKLEVKSYPAFTLRQPPQELPNSVLPTIQGLDSGDVAPMTSTADKGFIAYVKEKKLPDMSPDNARYAEVRTQLMRFNAGATQGAYLGDLVSNELKKSAPPAQ